MTHDLPHELANEFIQDWIRTWNCTLIGNYETQYKCWLQKPVWACVALFKWDFIGIISGFFIFWLWGERPGTFATDWNLNWSTCENNSEVATNTESLENCLKLDSNGIFFFFLFFFLGRTSFSVWHYSMFSVASPRGLWSLCNLTHKNCVQS